MSTPHDPPNEGLPAQYPQPGPYPPQPGPYGQSGPYGQPAGYGQPDQYAYNPYGTPYPSPAQQAPPPAVRRPGLMIVSLVLLILSALPFIAGGLFFLVLPIGPDDIPPGVLDQGQLDRAGITVNDLLTLFRVVGGVILAIALLYILFAVFAFRGRNWARIVVTILTVGFALLLVAGLAGGGGAGGVNLVITLAVLAASVGGVVLLFLADSNRYFARPR